MSPKIFVEMSRDVDNAANKGKRTVSRFKQLQDLYRQIADEDTRRLTEELKKYDESALQRDVLYLYFMQLGRDMYTGEVITDLSLCNKEHIYPQSKVKDDSILNNIVLVNSKINGSKTDTYPISVEIREKMTPFWKFLKDKGFISDEKFYRLTRNTAFSAEEKWGFINRQLVETRQSTKAVTELLKERYPGTEIVYVKAGLVSEFRHEFDLVKSRTINDLHHAKDAYLNIIVGNVYHSRFTRNWFMNNYENNYSINPKVIFSDIVKKVHLGNNTQADIVWQKKYEYIEKNLQRNYIHLTNYTFCQHGGFFDQNPVPAKSGLIPLKKGKPTEIYGGYNKSTASFFALALTEEIKKNKSKKELTLVPVDLLISDKFLTDAAFATQYIKDFIDPSAKKGLSVSFPLGLKPVKIKTIFEVDNGLRFALNGKSSGGSQLGIGISSSLLLDSFWETYIKRIESFCEKKRKNPNLVYSEKYDKFSKEQNINLYDILVTKLQSGMFSKRPANPLNALIAGRDKFVELLPEIQAEILLNLVSSFGTASGAGVNLTKIDGVAKAGVTTLSSSLSNWKKYFTTANIIYSDATGLHETKSINLLDLI